MDAPNATPRALLVHDGELADVRALLGELGVAVFEARRADGADLRQPWDLLVATPQLIPGAISGRPAPAATRIAVLPHESRTLASRLRRGDVDYVVRRPVHPDALRLLLLGALYRGPEKRRAPRVSVGTPVRVRVGLRRHPVLLSELSTSGCRLRARVGLRRGQRVSLLLPPGVACGRTLSLPAEVVRVTATADGSHEAALAFRPSARAAARLAEIVTRHVGGPCVLPEPAAPRSAPRTTRERRLAPRRAYPRRVIALGDEAARVLIGRDLSAGGMRVAPGPELRVGEELRLALHGSGEATPLVLSAQVMRDEGARGYVLQFGALAAHERLYLERLLAGLPALSQPCLRGDAGLVVSRILERRRA